MYKDLKQDDPVYVYIQNALSSMEVARKALDAPPPAQNNDFIKLYDLMRKREKVTHHKYEELAEAELKSHYDYLRNKYHD